jgi:hypothetical protein
MGWDPGSDILKKPIPDPDPQHCLHARNELKGASGFCLKEYQKEISDSPDNEV